MGGNIEWAGEQRFGERERAQLGVERGWKRRKEKRAELEEWAKPVKQ